MGVNSIHNRFYGFTSWSRTRTTPIDCPWIFMTNQLGSDQCTWPYELRSEGFVNGILETGGVMDKCVQMWTRNYGALGQTARVCFGVLCANRKKEEVKRDFGEKKETGEKKKGGTRKRGEKSSEKRRADRLRKRRGESQSFLLGDADQNRNANE
ncbi:hypothetical protein TNCV_3669551 [Trichonephila clavipes]|nr:hypothetical protein TNCV_3669551 [Trichonephila clavipes]